MAVSTNSLSSKFEIYKEGGEIMKKIHLGVKQLIKEGTSSKDINSFIAAQHVLHRLSNQPAELYDYPGHCCISINDCLCHGCPDETVLKEGDLVSVDIFFKYKGYCVDCCRSYLVCSNPKNLHKYKKEILLIKHNQTLLDSAVEYANLMLEQKGSVPYSIFGNYIYKAIINTDYAVSPEYCGHSIGETIHSGLFISSSFNTEKTLIKEGDTFCVEPIIAHSYKKNIHIQTHLEGAWNVMHKQGLKTSHWENTYFIKQNKIISMT